MRALKHPQTEDIELARVLYALSDPVRLEVVRQLDREGEATCAALDGGRPKSSMSHHFRVLRDAGLVLTRSEEIGRASCRERVWQYVSISVVAVSLKKKISATHLICLFIL